MTKAMIYDLFDAEAFAAKAAQDLRLAAGTEDAPSRLRAYLRSATANMHQALARIDEALAAEVAA
jgi:hypothetical protein